MCEPITMGILSAGLGVAQAVGTYAQQSQAAKNQDQMYAKNVANSQAAFSSEQNTLQQQDVQQTAAQAQQSFAMSEEAKRVEATQENEAASTGQAGLSVDSLLLDLERQEVDRQNASEQNLEWTLDDIASKKQASGANYVSNVNSVSKGVHPSMANLALGIVGAGMNGFSSYQDLKTKQQKATYGR